MPKFESPIKVSGIQSLSGNTTLLHLGPDNRVGIGTTAPDTKLHVDGTITASGLIVPPGVLSDQGDSAAAFGFNPNFAEWNGPPDNSPYVANGYTQDTTTTGRVIQSSDANLGGASAKFDNVDARWERPVKFESPLYRDIFVQGTVTYKYESYSSGEPGLAVTLTSRPRACNEYAPMTNTFIVPTLSENRETATGWQTVTWRAHTPADREITDLKVEVISTSAVVYDAETEDDVINDGGAGSSLTLGGGTAYEWYLDGFSLQFMHPDMRIDQLGRITGAYIAEATIDDLHIRDMISSTSSLVQREGTALYIQGEVANATYANGWSISKSGKIKATDIEIYSGSGQILIDANARDGDGHYNPFARWQGRSLADLDSDASSRLYGLNFEESNKTDLFIKTGYRATTGLDSDTIGTNDFSLYIANSTGTTLPDSGTGSTQLSNGSINFNGMTSNAPPGSIFTDGKSVVQGLRGSSDGTAAYILFLANTQKWDSNHGAQQKYHANTLLGEYGLYVIGKPTVGGWLYHPHANNTWYTIDEVQQGDRLHLKDFITIGKVGTDDAGNIIDSLTSLESPRALDSVTSDDSRGSFPPLGIPAGGILFADIYPNQWNHTANSGEVQLTNQKNSPNTRFAFIHPTSGTRYIANSSQGILTSLEDFPGSRYITFIGGNKTRTNPDGTGFTFDYDGHSPDFVAAFPLGNRWYYNQDEGKMSEFIPDPNIDCIVARVDSNGASFSGDGSSKITQVYRYAQREAVTEEGASLSDLIIDPPRGMASGGLVLADLTINREFQKSDNTFIANSGFIALSNPENNPRNEFYVIHPDNGNNWLVDTVGRGVATSLNPTNDVYGTRHIAFVGDDSTRFPAIASHYNVANDFIAVAKYDTNGNPRSDGQWYYDPGTGISDSHTFAPIANDFIIATLSAFDPDTDGIDQITRWAAEEGQLIIDGVPTSITSIRNLLEGRIDAANTVAQTALSEAQSAFANAVTAQANVAQALGLLDGAITIYFEEEDASRYYANALSSVDFDYNDLWINISTYNKAIDGSWYANAVFRYSNSLGGFADTGIDGPPTTKLAWRHDPTNPAGLSYLIGLTARGFADRSTTVYYRDHIGTPPNLFGPNVAVMSLSSSDVGELNFNPEGDLWYDTKSASVGEAPANHPYVYRTNATFSNSTPSRSGYITTGVGAWAQTVHNVGTSGTWNRNTAQTGWWSLQDSSAGDAAAGIAAETAAREDAITAEAATRADDIASTLNTAKVFAQAAADREILAFFADSTATPPTSSGNGDVWIHTDTAIDITTGTVNTGSVFVANTNNPPGSYSAGSINPPTRYWHQSPENAVGRSFLEGYVSTYAVNSIAYTAMATGNGKVVAFFGPHWPLDTGTHGPLVNTTPSGLENPDAHGDFWINTSNNNLMFVYNQNNSSIATEPDKAYSQTIYWDSSVGFSFNKSSDRSGWYSTEDPRTTNALSTSFDALANAETAQAAADREIIAFFQTDQPSHSASGNGDIWIDTDSFATLNTSSIYVFRQDIPDYINSPTSAIGQVYLNAFLAERKASRAESLAISVTGSGDLPFPVAPDANGIHVGATGNLAFYRNSSTEYLTDQFGSSHEGQVYVTNRGGVDLVGPNGHIWYPYSSGFGIPEEGTVGTNFYTGGATPDSLTVSNTTFSSLYLMYSNMNAATRFSGGSGTPFGTHDHIVPVRWNNADGQHQWEAVERDGTLHDFIPDAANGDFLVAKLTRPTAVPEGFSTLDSWIFKTLPSQTQAFTDGKIVTHFGPHFPLGNDPGDGTHGPQANLTPTGLYNPEPHGDFWINTSNNNIVFRYHANTINKYAQTAYHAPFRPETNDNKSGWYSTEDLRTANNESYNANNQIWLTNIDGNVFTLNAASANSQLFINFAFANIAFVNGAAYNANAAAYLAQASADREILAYFQVETDIPNASGTGDVWLHTDNLIKSDGTLNTGAIFVANGGASGGDYHDGSDHRWWEAPNNAIGLMYAKSYASGVSGEFQRGTNLMPRGYSLWDAPLSQYNINTHRFSADILPEPYAITSEGTGAGSSFANVAIERGLGSNSYINDGSTGGSSLRIEKAAITISDLGKYLVLAGAQETDSTQTKAQANQKYRIEIPKGKRWIFSYYARANTTAADTGIYTYYNTSNSTHYNSGVAYYVAANLRKQGFDVADEWKRHSHVIDLTGTAPATVVGGSETTALPIIGGTLGPSPLEEITSISPVLVFDSTDATDFYIDGLQLEEVASDIVTPSIFKEPSDAKSIVFGREITDGKIVTQYSNHFISDSTYYGPQPNITPSGLPNPEPHGDFWVDTGNNQIMFRYNQNTTINYAQTAYWTTGVDFNTTTGKSGWYSLEDPRTAVNESYAANNQIWLTNIDGNVFTLNAASANSQLFINFAFANIAFVNGAAYNAQAAADLARISADREILAYFQIHSDVPEATGNGDVWIHTDNLIKPADGTLNTGAIFVSNTHDTVVGIPDDAAVGAHFWYASPENAIGLMYAKSYAAGHAGDFDRSTNIMPRAWSLFDAPRELYSNTAPLKDTVPYPYYNQHEVGQQPTSLQIVDDQNPPVGGKSLYLHNPTISSYIFLGSNTVPWNSGFAGPTDHNPIEIPFGKKWMLSWYAKNAAGAVVGVDSGVHIQAANNSHSDLPAIRISRGVGAGGTQDFVGTDWERHWFGFDLSGDSIIEGVVNATSTGLGSISDAGFATEGGVNIADSANGINRIAIRIDPGGVSTTPARTFTYYSGFQLEDVTASGRVVPSEFQEPSDTSALIFDREITDGKIVTQYYASEQSIGYGPQANVTPSGLPNPEPHGDFLVDTSNNNIMFRYHQNIPSARAFDPDHSTFAQTLIFTTGGASPGDADGWYALEDPRTSNALATAHAANTTAQEALQRAASAASAADAEILVFFESSTNASMYLDTYNYGSLTGPATGNGDIWIQVDQVYNPDGTQNTGSIFFANLSPSEGWSQSPDNAIGRAFLESFTTTGVKNWMPAGYSTWNEEQQNFFGAPIVYNIGEGAVQNGDTPYPVIPANGKAIVNTSFGYTDSGSLQLTTTSGTAPESYIYLANTGGVARKATHAAGPPSTTLRIPRGKRWIFSYYAFTNTAFTDTNGDATTTSVFLWMDNSANTTANVGSFYKNGIKHTRNQWKRHSHVLDLSNSSPSATIDEYTDKYGSWQSATSYHTTFSSGTTHLTEPAGGWQHPLVADFDSITVRFDVDGAVGNTFWFDGIQLEEAPGAQVLAGPFSDPDRRISDHFTRAISDGKIVSHYANGASSGSVYYGPRPQVTPSGTINPVPHGDFWIDTANNNATYRYNQNNSYPLPTTLVGAPSINAVAQTAFWSTVAYENNKTGWYSVADGRIGILAGNVATAFGDIADTLSQVSDLEAATDGEINIYFKPADGGEFVTGGGPGTGGTPGSYAYGDIWINVADSQKYANGTLNPTSIHRRSNSSGGFHDAASLPVAGDAYRWKQEAENAIGGVYLSAYAAQNLADSKVTSFFTGNTNGGNEFLSEEGPGGNPVHLYGPQANLTPTGHINTNPDGDIWINTANNNEMYVYNVNGGGGAGGYRQRVYWLNSMEDGPEGWYSSEDLRIGSHQIAIDLAKGAGGDRMVEVFFAPHTSMQDASGNGDIWIQTDNIINLDGSANTNAIFVGNTLSTGITDGSDHYWHKEPNSALGRSHLQKLVAETGSNFLPRGYSTFDVAETDYHIFDNSSSPTNSTQVVGTDANRPYRIGHNNTYNDEAPQIVSGTPGGNTYFGEKSLRFQLAPAEIGDEVETTITFGGGPDDANRFTTTFPTGRKWVYSWWQNCSETNVNYGTPLLRAHPANSSYISTGIHFQFRDGSENPQLNNQTTTSAYEWRRFYVFLDLTGNHTILKELVSDSDHSDLVDDDVTGVTDTYSPIAAESQFRANEIDRMIFTHMYAGRTGAPVIHIDGMQLEDVTNSDRRTPSTFQEPSPASEIDFSRAIADGKIINFISNAFHSSASGPGDHYYGPDPSVTPNGLTNPEPYGDKWISMSSPYKTYMYFSNATNKTSQTAFHAPASKSTVFPAANTHWPFSPTGNNDSGWYEYRDTGSALTQEGFQVALGQVSIGAAHWSENGQLVLDDITFDDDTDAGTAPAVVVTNTRDFGPNKELLLNPVPPPDTNLHAHWTLNSYDVDDDGVYLVRDVSGRNNHAKIGYQGAGTFGDHGMNDFVDHDPASDVINVSGNRSFRMHSNYQSDRPFTYLTLASNGSVSDTSAGSSTPVRSSHTYEGSSYPVNIVDTKFNKTTLTFWWKPGDQGPDLQTKFIVSQGTNVNGFWDLDIPHDGDARNANGDFHVRWASWDGSGTAFAENLHHKPGSSVYLDGWYGANDGGHYTPFRFNEWHFVAIQTNHDDDKQSLWIYREGEGLLYYNVRAFAGTDATTVNRSLYLNGGIDSSGTFNTRSNANGNYDEVRLYNSILTPRNIRYLYMNPTGRPRQLQPRPGLAVKKGYAQFHDGGWQDGVRHTVPGGQLFANSHAYFHGFDVDGNPADVDPYISFNGQVKTLDRGAAHLFISGSAGAGVGNSYYGNTGYILYNDTEYPNQGNKPKKYVFAMPVGSNTTQTHTWMYQDFGDTNNSPKKGWKHFTPDDSKDLVIGEAKLANLQQMITYSPGADAGLYGTGRYIQFDTVEAYQFARKPSIVRESYNFNITPQDFIGNFSGGDHFFANSYWWANNLINGVFIAEATIGNAAIIELSAGKIQAGTIGVGVKVGGENKILLDGLNNRIVISD